MKLESGKRANGKAGLFGVRTAFKYILNDFVFVSYFSDKQLPKLVDVLHERMDE